MQYVGWGLLGITGDYWGWGIPTNHPCMEATAFTFGHEKHDLNTVSGGVNNNFDSQIIDNFLI